MPVLLNLLQNGWMKIAKGAAQSESGLNLSRTMLLTVSVRNISCTKVKDYLIF